METNRDMYKIIPIHDVVGRLWYKGFDLNLTLIVISPSIELLNFY